MARARGASAALIGVALIGVALIGVALLGLLLVGWSGPNLAKPDLGPRGWAPGTLPFTLSGTATTVLLAVAYLLGAVGVGLGLWQRAQLRIGWWPVVVLAGLSMLATPFGSADHTNYAAYGRIFSQGGDPYVASPIDWRGGADPITSAVEAPWTTTPSIYGPFGTLLQALAAWLGGDNLRQVIWVWQILIVVCWLGCRWLLRRLTDEHARVDLLWTFNPLVFGTAVLGAHVDTIATVAVLAVLVLSVRSPLGAGVALSLAACTKVTYAAAGLAVLLAWWAHDRSKALRHSAIAALGFVVPTLALHLIVGPHVYQQLGRARQSVSLATPWRIAVELLTGPLPSATVRSLIFVSAALAMIVMAWLLHRLTAGLAAPTVLGQGARWTFVLSAAYALVAPYSLPWYDLLIWVLLPLLAASRLDHLLLGRAVVMAWSYVPGRVIGLEQPGPALMLTIRKVVAPYVNLALWGALSVLAGRSGTRPSGPTPRAAPAPPSQ